jgi:hypothetical protein
MRRLLSRSTSQRGARNEQTAGRGRAHCGDGALDRRAAGSACRFGVPATAAAAARGQVREAAQAAAASRLLQASVMKKTTSRKLALRTQTIAVLTPETLERVVGGTLSPIGNGIIMRDTIIVRPTTSG